MKGERLKIKGESLVNKDHPEVIEIWNLVFMEYNRNDQGLLEKLSKKHVDTGMGFERLCMVLQNKKSSYETDLFLPIINRLEKISKTSFTDSEKVKVAYRVIVDHIRSVVFCIGDGQIPSNSGPGYVVRRILRRAIRYGFVFLDLKEPFLHELVDEIYIQFKDVFPSVFHDNDNLKLIIKNEEILFLKTLQKGLLTIDDLINKSESKKISGLKVFELYDRYGFPKDLTSLILNEHSFSFDENEYQQCLKKQRELSKNASSVNLMDWNHILNINNEGFCGYDNLEFNIKILMYREVVSKDRKLFQLVFNKTPFYPESGGQVGDRGLIKSEHETIDIIDTKKENNLIIHFAKKLPVNLNSDFKTYVNKNKRTLSSRNHSATHLLHFVLRDVIGKHVEQKGSYVSDEYLRFDFSHTQALDSKALSIIENKVNEKISLSIKLNEMRSIPIQDAKNLGAISLFGEKYGEKVRVIQFEDSIELCGGTHVHNSSEIGLFKIISEQSVASGIRRIEAVTSINAIKFYEENLIQLNLIKQKLKYRPNPLKIIDNLISENKRKEDIIQIHEKEKLVSLKEKVLKNTQIINGVNVIVTHLNIPTKSLKDMCFQLTKNEQNTFVFASVISDNKLILNLALTEDLINNKKWDASDLIKIFSKSINGSGGGQNFFAVASSNEISKIDDLQKTVISFLQNL